MSKPLPVPPTTEAEIALRFATETNAELAKAFGLEVRQVRNIGARKGLTKTAEAVSRARLERPQTKDNTLMDRVRRAVAVSDRKGRQRQQLAADCPDASQGQLTAALNKLIVRREVFRAGHVGSSIYFITPELARAHDERQAVQPPAPPAARPGRAGHRTAAAPARPPAVVPPTVKIATARGPAHLPGVPLVDSRTRLTIGNPVPGPEARWHTDPQPIFSAAGPGHYADTAARPWVAAVTGARP